MVKKKDLPKPKFGHASAVCGSKIVITSGISDLSTNMGMRSVPMADLDCHMFDIFANRWDPLPDVPIGKLHPVLIVINNRFVFKIAGIDDYDYDIYRLDMHNLQNAWSTLTLDTTKAIVDDLVYTNTRNYLCSVIDQD